MQQRVRLFRQPAACSKVTSKVVGAFDDGDGSHTLTTAMDRIFGACFLCLFLAYASLIAMGSQAPAMQDYPDWVYQGVLFAKAMGGHPAVGYALKAYPVPNTFTTLGVGLLVPLVGWASAAKLWIVFVCGALALAAVRLVRALDAPAPTLLLLGPSVLFGVDLWTGNVNFQLGLALLLWGAAFLLENRRPSVAAAALLAATFFAHMLPCAATLMLVGALALEQRDWRWLWVTLPTLLLIAWYAMARSPVEISANTLSPWHTLPALAGAGACLLWCVWKVPPRRAVAKLGALAGLGLLLWLWAGVAAGPSLQLIARSKFASVAGVFGPFQVLGPPSPAMVPPRLFLLAASVGVGLALVVIFLQWKAWTTTLAHAGHLRFIAAASVSLSLAFVFSPLDGLGVTGIDTRFLHLGLCLGLPLAGIGSRRWLPSLATAALAVTLLNLYQFARVQFGSTAVSLPPGVAASAGTISVNPAMRMGYYQALEHGQFQLPIFPTALFRAYRP